jgi:(1->4)-alpha-D-glucan 1-alpha-D-glucosylmutase
MKPLCATYRLQLHGGFAFADAQTRLPYWRALGVSHLYLSPITEAAARSTHFYDMVDPTRVSAELGGEDAFRAFAQAAQSEGLSLILDIVPNHMAVGAANPYWMEMLERGRDAPASRIFDIDWGGGQVHLPFLRTTLDEALSENAFSLDVGTAGRIVLRYFEHEFPLRPETAAPLREKAAVGSDSALRAVLRETAPGDVLEGQHWRLAHWRTANTEVNYRRFFDVATLAGVRIEDPEVFELFHRLPLRLIAEGLVQGLRIDHIDGLALPAEYCRRLREHVGPDVLIYVEKILALDEAIPDWPIDGTTGYQTLNFINGLFIDSEGYEKLRGFAVTKLGVQGNAQERIAGAKREILNRSFVADLNRVLAAAEPIAGGVPKPVWRAAVAELIARLPVYRTYLISEPPAATDEALLSAVIDDVAVHAPQASEAANLLRRCFTGHSGPEVAEFRLRLQQLTGPVMAKGYEDTELYRYVVLLSANEVGSNIDWPYLTPGEFHARVAARERWNRNLVPLATHDTKRGGDARARLNVLTEMAESWMKYVSHWSRMNAALRTDVGGEAAPDAADEAFIYQTMLAIWPADLQRLQNAIRKSIREAKRRSSWTDPDEHYERALMAFLETLLSSDRGADFRADFAEQAAIVAAAGLRNSRHQTVLQFTVPGVPDIYQGAELWDFRLVDPDNRGAVDWGLRAELMTKDEAAWDDPTGAGKLSLMRRLLALRRDNPVLFADGTYIPLSIESGVDCSVSGIAFVRRSEDNALLVVTETRAAYRDEGRRVITLPAELAGTWTDVFSGRRFSLRGAVALRDLPPLPLLLLRQGDGGG